MLSGLSFRVYHPLLKNSSDSDRLCQGLFGHSDCCRGRYLSLVSHRPILSGYQVSQDVSEKKEVL